MDVVIVIVAHVNDIGDTEVLHTLLNETLLDKQLLWEMAANGKGKRAPQEEIMTLK